MIKTISVKTTNTVSVDLDKDIDMLVLLAAITFRKCCDLSDLYIIAFSVVNRCTIETLNLNEKLLPKSNFWLVQFAHYRTIQ